MRFQLNSAVNRERCCDHRRTDHRPVLANEVPAKSPRRFPDGGFLLASQLLGNVHLDYISTVAACSTNSAIWSKFM